MHYQEVYYANYLKYLERSRRDYLYKLSFDYKKLLDLLNFILS